jgi:hypothetical protein
MDKEIIETGVVKGETCNRNGCTGIIDEHEKEGSCSCHINPPCSYCTTDAAYCPVCEWEPGDDYKPYTPTKEQENRWQKENDEWAANRDIFYKRYAGQEPIEKLETRTESHTNASQKVLGVFPAGTETRATIEPKVIGSWGGRFERFTETTFCYIAYTD